MVGTHAAVFPHPERQNTAAKREAEVLFLETLLLRKKNKKSQKSISEHFLQTRRSHVSVEEAALCLPVLTGNVHSSVPYSRRVQPSAINGSYTVREGGEELSYQSGVGTSPALPPSL